MEDKELYLRTLAAMYVDGYLTDEDEVLAEDLLQKSPLFREFVNEYKDQLEIELKQLDQEREESIANIRDAIVSFEEPERQEPKQVKVLPFWKSLIAASLLVGVLFYFQKQRENRLSKTVKTMQDSLKIVNAQNQELSQKLTIPNYSNDNTISEKAESLKQSQQSQLPNLVTPDNNSSAVVRKEELPFLNRQAPDNENLTQHTINISFHPNSGDSKGVTSNKNKNEKIRNRELTMIIKSLGENDLGTFSIDGKGNFTLNISLEMYHKIINRRVDIYQKENNDYEISINDLKSYLLDVNDNKIYPHQ